MGRAAGGFAGLNEFKRVLCSLVSGPLLPSVACWGHGLGDCRRKPDAGGGGCGVRARRAGRPLHVQGRRCRRPCHTSRMAVMELSPMPEVTGRCWWQTPCALQPPRPGVPPHTHLHWAWARRAAGPQARSAAQRTREPLAGCHSMPPGPRQTQPPPTPRLPPPRPEGQRPGHHAPTAPARFRAALEQGRLLAPPQLTEGCVVFPPSAERPAAEDGKGLSTGAGSGLAEGHSLGRSAARHVLEPTGRLQRCAHPMLTAACSQLPGGGSNPRVHGDGGKHDGPLLRGTLLSLGWQLRHTKCGWGTVR